MERGARCSNEEEKIKKMQREKRKSPITSFHQILSLMMIT
jgi:hypothetical protein